MQVPSSITIAELSKLLGRFDKVTIRGFGSFHWGNVSERVARDLNTGERRRYGPSRRLYFKPARYSGPRRKS